MCCSLVVDIGWVARFSAYKINTCTSRLIKQAVPRRFRRQSSAQVGARFAPLPLFQSLNAFPTTDVGCQAEILALYQCNIS